MKQKLDRIQAPMYRVGEAAEELGRCLGNLCSALSDFIHSFVEFVKVVLPPEILAEAVKDPRIPAAIAGASPRVRHLALHGKKRRTRKKNLKRALREYQRKEPKP
jgi:hypothetical protein